MAKLSPARRQLRDFTLIWAIITLVMGGCTFFAIYLALPGFLGESDALGSLGGDSGQVAAALTSTTAPTRRSVTNTPTHTATATDAPTNTPAPTETEVVEATVEPTVEAAAAEPTLTPTLLPNEETAFEPGIQVLVNPAFDAENQRVWMSNVYEGLGLRWYKQQVRWELIETERGVYDWTILDFALPIAAEYPGLRVMVSVVTAPDWSRDPGVNTERHGPPANYDDYVNFVRAMLERYPGMIHAVEVWNEQNLDREWTSSRGLSARNYVDLLGRTYRAIREIDPGIIVISGALSPTGLSDGVRAIDDFEYMDQMIAAGMLDVTDCVGAHHNGYNIGPNVAWNNVPNDPTATFRGPFDNPHHSWSFYSTLQTYHNKIEAAGGDQPLCVTEFGWAVSDGIEGFNVPGLEFANDNTLQEQADWLYEALTSMEEWGFVRLAFIWNLNYGPMQDWSPTSDNPPYSLIAPGYVNRPGWEAVRFWSQERGMIP